MCFYKESGRRFDTELGSAKNDTEKPLAATLTRNQMNMIEVHKRREVKTLLKEASVSYSEKQAKRNKLFQDVTETNEMPPLVMTKLG